MAMDNNQIVLGFKDKTVSLIHRLSQIFIAIVSTFLGVFIGPVLQKIVPPLFDAKNLLYITFIAIASLFLISSIIVLMLVTSIQRQINKLTRNTSALADAAGPHISIVPYTKASTELQVRTHDARFEILVLSNYKRYDWDNHKPVDFDASYSTNNNGRQNHYHQSQSKLKKVKNENFRFVKIVQIPAEHQLEDVFPHDPIYKDDCRFIVQLSNANPQFANLRVSEIFFQNTFCIIDRSFIYLEFDVRSFLKKNVQPFVMIIDGSSDSYIVKNFVDLFERINAVSKRIESIPEN